MHVSAAKPKCAKIGMSQFSFLKEKNQDVPSIHPKKCIQQFIEQYERIHLDLWLRTSTWSFWFNINILTAQATRAHDFVHWHWPSRWKPCLRQQCSHALAPHPWQQMASKRGCGRMPYKNSIQMHRMSKTSFTWRNWNLWYILEKKKHVVLLRQPGFHVWSAT